MILKVHSHCKNGRRIEPNSKQGEKTAKKKRRRNNEITKMINDSIGVWLRWGAGRFGSTGIGRIVHSNIHVIDHPDSFAANGLIEITNWIRNQLWIQHFFLRTGSEWWPNSDLTPTLQHSTAQHIIQPSVCCIAMTHRHWINNRQK